MPDRRHPFAAFTGGAAIGTLGGLIGLGGAEFRLPLLVGFFQFAALQAVIVNKAISLVVVASALPFRSSTVPFADLAAHWPIIVNLLAGSLLGAWLGAGWATRLASYTLYRVLAGLLVAIAVVLVAGHDTGTSSPLLTGTPQLVLGVIAGFAIGIVAALLGVAGGELLDPNVHSSVRRRHQARRQHVAGRQSADDDRRVCALLPRHELRRAERKSSICIGDGGGVVSWQLHRRPTARHRSVVRTAADAGSYIGHFGSADVAA